MQRIGLGWLLFALLVLCYGPARAQPKAGDVRLWLDTDVMSVAWVKLDPDPPGREVKSTVFSVGPNQLGATRVAAPTTPLGVGMGYMLRDAWLLGVRAGFGYDVISPDNAADISYLAWSFMPGIWFLPRAGAHPEVRWWVNFSPVLDYIREKQGSLQNTRFGGCFSLGAGTFLFASPRASFDVGLFFEGRFPDIDSDPSGQKLEISELRWLLRLGLSLWR